jgi:glycosyltransferase involved in cell wall biosynthesis
MVSGDDRKLVESINKRGLRIALFFERLPDTGGGFHLAYSTIESLTQSRATNHEFVVFTQFERTRQGLLESSIEPIMFKNGATRLIDRWSATTLGGAILRRLRRLGFRRLGRHLDALLDEHDIDLVLLPEIGEIALRIGDHPFVVTIWDLDHLDHPEFPEIYGERVFERREKVHRATLPRAMAVITNLPSLARRISDVYQVDFDRIIVLPFLVPLGSRRHAAEKGSITAKDVARRYNLPERYVFYPAYFSVHKNHLYLLEALIVLEQHHGISLHAVFCGGGDPGDQEKVERQVDALGMSERVHFLGLVPDEHIPALCEGAFAMVMPSYFGPSNVPPLEAAAVGCPVICSDFLGCREQMGEAALYCDLANPGHLADHLAKLFHDAALVERLRTAGLKLATSLSKFDYAQALAPLFDEYAYVCRRWKWPEKFS